MLDFIQQETPSISAYQIYRKKYQKICLLNRHSIFYLYMLFVIPHKSTFGNNNASNDLLELGISISFKPTDNFLDSFTTLL